MSASRNAEPAMANSGEPARDPTINDQAALEIASGQWITVLQRMLHVHNMQGPENFSKFTETQTSTFSWRCKLILTVTRQAMLQGGTDPRLAVQENVKYEASGHDADKKKAKRAACLKLLRKLAPHSTPFAIALSESSKEIQPKLPDMALNEALQRTNLLGMLKDDYIQETPPNNYVRLQLFSPFNILAEAHANEKGEAEGAASRSLILSPKLAGCASAEQAVDPRLWTYLRNQPEIRAVFTTPVSQPPRSSFHGPSSSPGTHRPLGMGMGAGGHSAGGYGGYTSSGQVHHPVNVGVSGLGAAGGASSPMGPQTVADSRHRPVTVTTAPIPPMTFYHQPLHTSASPAASDVHMGGNGVHGVRVPAGSLPVSPPSRAPVYAQKGRQNGGEEQDDVVSTSATSVNTEAAMQRVLGSAPVPGGTAWESAKRADAEQKARSAAEAAPMAAPAGASRAVPEPVTVTTALTRMPVPVLKALSKLAYDFLDAASKGVPLPTAIGPCVRDYLCLWVARGLVRAVQLQVEPGPYKSCCGLGASLLTFLIRHACMNGSKPASSSAAASTSVSGMSWGPLSPEACASMEQVLVANKHLQDVVDIMAFRAAVLCKVYSPESPVAASFAAVTGSRRARHAREAVAAAKPGGLPGGSLHPTTGEPATRSSLAGAAGRAPAVGFHSYPPQQGDSSEEEEEASMWRQASAGDEEDENPASVSAAHSNVNTTSRLRTDAAELAAAECLLAVCASEDSFKLAVGMLPTLLVSATTADGSVPRGEASALVLQRTGASWKAPALQAALWFLLGQAFNAGVIHPGAASAIVVTMLNVGRIPVS